MGTSKPAKPGELYALTAGVLRRLPYEVKRVGSQGFASADSVHRNIAEGYCRRSIKEYLQFLYIALGSLGESVSGYHALHAASQFSDDDFEALDSHAYKPENGLLRLVESIERKKEDGDWIDSLVVKEEEEEVME